jgi:hypothetical protein
LPWPRTPRHDRGVQAARSGRAARLGLAGFAAVIAWWGGWAWFAPRSFFAGFPGFGHRWTAAYPPYNEHLVTDLGATFLTLSFLLVIAAALGDRRVALVVLAGVLLFDALHLAYHAGASGQLGPHDYLASIVALTLGVLVPVGLLAMVWLGGSRTGRVHRPDRTDTDLDAGADHDYGQGRGF